MEAYVHGISTRNVDDLVAALGIDPGISVSEVSGIGGELDAVVATFRDRSLAHCQRRTRFVSRPGVVVVSIMYTPFAVGFWRDRTLDPGFRMLLERRSAKNGWFVLVSTLLDPVAGRRGFAVISAADRPALERR